MTFDLIARPFSDQVTSVKLQNGNSAKTARDTRKVIYTQTCTFRNVILQYELIQSQFSTHYIGNFISTINSGVINSIIQSIDIGFIFFFSITRKSSCFLIT